MNGGRLEESSVTTTKIPKTRKPLLSCHSAMWSILLLWVAYTIISTLHPSDVLAAVIEFFPGILSVIILVAAGFSIQECYLRVAPISKTGMKLLAVSLLFFPFILLTGYWTGWNQTAALIYAPASGISQELFFRAALLPVLLVIFKAKPSLAIFIHSLLFALWHVPTAYMTAPLGGLIGIVVVTFVCGLLWGKQVQLDRTVIWLMGCHSILLFIMSFFTWEWG